MVMADPSDLGHGKKYDHPCKLFCWSPSKNLDWKKEEIMDPHKQKLWTPSIKQNVGAKFYLLIFNPLYNFFLFMTMVKLSALVKRFSFSCMRDFLKNFLLHMISIEWKCPCLATVLVINFQHFLVVLLVRTQNNKTWSP